MNDPKQELADFARRIARENRHAAALERQRELSLSSSLAARKSKFRSKPS